MASKKQKNNVRLALFIGSIILAIINVCIFLFTDVIQFYLGEDPIDDATFSGMQVIFGHSESTEIMFIKAEVEILKFSFMNLLPLILILAGIIFGIFNSRLFGFIAGGLLITAAVLFVFVPNFTILTEEGKNIYETLSGALELNMRPTNNVYIATSLSAVGGLFLVGKSLLK